MICCACASDFKVTLLCMKVEQNQAGNSCFAKQDIFLFDSRFWAEQLNEIEPMYNYTKQEAC